MLEYLSITFDESVTEQSRTKLENYVRNSARVRLNHDIKRLILAPQMPRAVRFTSEQAGEKFIWYYKADENQLYISADFVSEKLDQDQFTALYIRMMETTALDKIAYDHKTFNQCMGLTSVLMTLAAAAMYYTGKPGAEAEKNPDMAASISLWSNLLAGVCLILAIGAAYVIEWKGKIVKNLHFKSDVAVVDSVGLKDAVEELKAEYEYLGIAAARKLGLPDLAERRKYMTMRAHTGNYPDFDHPSFKPGR